MGRGTMQSARKSTHSSKDVTDQFEDLEFGLGDQVLCRYSSYPYWPATVDNSHQARWKNKFFRHHKLRSGEPIRVYWCTFANEDTGGWVRVDRMVKYHPDLAEKVRVDTDHESYDDQSSAIAAANEDFRKLPGGAEMPQVPSDFENGGMDDEDDDLDSQEEEEGPPPSNHRKRSKKKTSIGSGSSDRKKRRRSAPAAAERTPKKRKKDETDDKDDKDDRKEKEDKEILEVIEIKEDEPVDLEGKLQSANATIQKLRRTLRRKENEILDMTKAKNVVTVSVPKVPGVGVEMLDEEYFQKKKITADQFVKNLNQIKRGYQEFRELHNHLETCRDELKEETEKFQKKMQGAVKQVADVEKKTVRAEETLCETLKKVLESDVPIATLRAHKAGNIVKKITKECVGVHPLHDLSDALLHIWMKSAKDYMIEHPSDEEKVATKKSGNSAMKKYNSMSTDKHGDGDGDAAESHQTASGKSSSRVGDKRRGKRSRKGRKEPKRRGSEMDKDKELGESDHKDVGIKDSDGKPSQDKEDSGAEDVEMKKSVKRDSDVKDVEMKDSDEMAVEVKDPGAKDFKDKTSELTALESKKPEVIKPESKESARKDSVRGKAGGKDFQHHKSDIIMEHRPRIFAAKSGGTENRADKNPDVKSPAGKRKTARARLAGKTPAILPSTRSIDEMDCSEKDSQAMEDKGDSEDKSVAEKNSDEAPDVMIDDSMEAEGGDGKNSKLDEKDGEKSEIVNKSEGEKDEPEESAQGDKFLGNGETEGKAEEVPCSDKQETSTEQYQEQSEDKKPAESGTVVGKESAANASDSDSKEAVDQKDANEDEEVHATSDDKGQEPTDDGKGTEVDVKAKKVDSDTSAKKMDTETPRSVTLSADTEENGKEPSSTSVPQGAATGVLNNAKSVGNAQTESNGEPSAEDGGKSQKEKAAT